MTWTTRIPNRNVPCKTLLTGLADIGAAEPLPGEAGFSVGLVEDALVARFTVRDLAVVIPTRDRWEILGYTLEGLRGQSVEGFETVVVVDGIDQTVPELPGVTLVVKPQGGPGAARNAGVAATTRPLVLFLGDDTIPARDVVERHLDRHNNEPDRRVAVLGLAQWHPEVSGTRLARWLDWSNTQFDYGRINEDDAGPGRFFTCNVSLKRDFFLEAGGFDEDFKTFYEDIDCGMRLGDRGLVLRYEPAAVVSHLHRYTWESIRRRFEWVARGERLMTQKHPGFGPWFSWRMTEAWASPRMSALWPAVVDHVPRALKPLRREAEKRANTAYFQELAPIFTNAWHADVGVEELKAYLGEDFDEARFWSHNHLVEAEFTAAGDEATFYRTSESYLYDLTAFAMWGTKVPYFEAIRYRVPRAAKVLDYGCGIGTDGLRLIDDGYRVSFADFDNPSTRFLKWRLDRRELDAPVYDLDGDVPGGFDLVYAIDVIEHVPDPWAFLAELESRAGLVAVNFLEHDPADEHVHRDLPIPRLLDHAARKGLLWYGRYHSGRSHFVIYRASGSEPSAMSAARSYARRHLGGRVRHLRIADLDRFDRALDGLRR